MFSRLWKRPGGDEAAERLLDRLRPDAAGRYPRLNAWECEQVIGAWRRFPALLRLAGGDEQRETIALAVHQHCAEVLGQAAEEHGLDGSLIARATDLAQRIVVGTGAVDDEWEWPGPKWGNMAPR